MTKNLSRWALLILALVFQVLVGAAGPAFAQEYIKSFRSDIRLEQSGDVTVTEYVTVNAEGRDIKRGIFRDFPVYMRDANGRRQRVAFEVVSVSRDGQPEAWHEESISRGVRVYMGSEKTQLSTGFHIYALTYRTDRQIRFFDDHDEFYWNVTGNGWMFPIEEASATVTLPQGVRATDTIFFTGKEGSTDRNARATGTQTAPAFVTTRGLSAKEGLTISIAMPKGSFAPPGPADLRRQYIRDYTSAFLCILGLGVVGIYYILFWRRVGRDPKRGIIVPRWHPPEGLSPALVNYVDNKGFSGEGWNALSASFIDLALKGYVTIDPLGSGITVLRTEKPVDELLPSGQASLIQELGAPGSKLTINKTNGKRIQSMAAAFRNAISKEHSGKYYRHNVWFIVGGMALGALFILLLLIFGDFDPELLDGLLFSCIGSVLFTFLAVKATKTFLRKRSVLVRIGAALGLVFTGFLALCVYAMMLLGIAGSMASGDWPVAVGVCGILMMNAFFFFIMGAPTPLGARHMDEIEGLRLYLTLAEQDRMNLSGPPQMSPQHYETLLPYAVALDVEEPWSRAFESWLASAASAGSYQPPWYLGGGSRDFSLGGFSSSMASTISSSIPSSSSSGFSGGSSGGGGGGGGGGGW